jgi:hypothetical protein
MCRSYHTGQDHPACDAVLRHAPLASLDGTLHRHLHALEQSPAYILELPAFCVSLTAFRKCISSRTNSSKPFENRLYILHYAIILTFLAEKDELGSQNSVAAHSENGSEPPCCSALPYLKAESKLQA